MFENTEVWKKVNYEFSKMLMIQAPGLKCVTEYEELESNFGEVLDRLFKKMSLKKYCYNSPIFTKGLCITKECSVTKKFSSYKSRWIFIL